MLRWASRAMEECSPKTRPCLRDVYITMLLINLDDIEDNLGGPKRHALRLMGPMDVFDYRVEVLTRTASWEFPPKK